MQCAQHPPVAKSDRTLVVLIHGIMSKPAAMKKIEFNLNEQGYYTLNFDYASLHDDIDTVIVQLYHQINPIIDQYDSVCFVTHSLGGLICRAYLSQYQSEKYHSIVMIAPPNRGSIVADKLADFKPYQWIYGPAGQGLGKEDTDYWKKYPAPPIPFGIIAGGIGNDKGMNPLIPGDDDFVVATSETELPGYKDYILFPATHTTLMWHDDVVAEVLSFLKDGCFIPLDKLEKKPIFIRQPVTKWPAE